MKARVIATGKIVDVVANGNYYDTTDNKERYYSYELDFNDTYDYWTRLEHQAAIAAMQGMFSNPRIMETLGCKNDHERLVETTISIAAALVEKLKEKEERK